MQQKYCDHGRSTVLLTITWLIWRARNCCGSGGKPRKASIFPSMKSSIGLTDGSDNPMDILARIETDMRGHQAPRTHAGSTQRSTPTLLPLRSATLRMSSLANSSKQPTWTPASTVIASAGIDGLDEMRREIQTEIDVCRAQCFAEQRARADRHVAQSVKPSARSSSSATYLRGDADAGDLNMRTVVVSSGPSSASTVARSKPAAPASDTSSGSGVGSASSALGLPVLCVHAFSSRLSSFRKRQSVPSAMIFCGLDLMKPTSCRRSA